MSEYDLFLSYPHADQEAVSAIAEALRERGLRVWLDEAEIADFESITRAIEDGLARAKALLAYYSKNYRRSRACQWELTAAYLAAEHEGDPLRRVLVVNPLDTTDHIFPVALRDGLFQKAPALDDPAGVAELAERVGVHVARIDTALGDVRPAVPPTWYGARPTGSTRFVGRLADMWDLHSTLNASDAVVITGQAGPDVAQLRGLGGIGKTLLAQEYALRFGAAYPGGIFWLRAYGNDAMRPSLDPIALDAERSRQIAEVAMLLGV